MAERNSHYLEEMSSTKDIIDSSNYKFKTSVSNVNILIKNIQVLQSAFTELLLDMIKVFKQISEAKISNFDSYYAWLIEASEKYPRNNSISFLEEKTFIWTPEKINEIFLIARETFGRIKLLNDEAIDFFVGLRNDEELIKKFSKEFSKIFQSTI